MAYPIDYFSPAYWAVGNFHIFANMTTVGPHQVWE
jgi:hypothetical protein